MVGFRVDRFGVDIVTLVAASLVGGSGHGVMADALVYALSTANAGARRSAFSIATRALQRLRLIPVASAWVFGRLTRTSQFTLCPAGYVRHCGGVVAAVCVCTYHRLLWCHV
jgi:hypothetical protein